jgi:hypothetical protein
LGRDVPSCVRPEKDCAGEAQQTRPLVREGTPHQQTRGCLQTTKNEKRNWSRVPDGCLTPIQTLEGDMDRRNGAVAASAMSGGRGREATAYVTKALIRPRHLTLLIPVDWIQYDAAMYIAQARTYWAT